MGCGHWMSKCDGGDDACFALLRTNLLYVRKRERSRGKEPRKDKGEKNLEGNWSGEPHFKGKQVTYG